MRSAPTSSEDNRALQLALGIIVAVTLIRCAVLVISPLDLYPDEAQYWWWAQTPAAGYFSKPPMIAWIIWFSTTVFGQAEWAIRIASPLFHAATALLIFGIAHRKMDSRLSAITAVAYLTLPGISYSSGLISTDVPLLFFWAAALYAFLRGCEDHLWRWSIIGGVALGLGLLSKYAMLYFFAGAAISAFWTQSARRYLLSTQALATLSLAAFVFAPNLIWNGLHGFPTVSHTAANADWARSRYSVTGLLAFALGQFGVFGPILMAGWIAALWRLARNSQRRETDPILAAFSLPPLLLILIQAFVAGANANWAATAYVAATPLAVAEIAQWWKTRALWASFVISGIVCAALWVFLTQPEIADRAGIGNVFKREEGWRALGAEVARVSRGAPFDAIAADNRSIAAELLYYARPRRAPMRVWSRDFGIRDHFEMTMRLEPGSKRVLLAIEPTAAKRVLASFDSATFIRSIRTTVGGHHQRLIELYDARDYRGPQLILGAENG